MSHLPLPNLMGQMYFPAWLHLLRTNDFDVDRALRARAARFTAGSLVGTALGALQQLCYGARIARTRVESPLFVIGHWRSGTTWLFDLLARDGRFAYPTHMTCACAQHFLLTRPLIDWLSQRMEVSTRGVDSVLSGPSEPKEDEFALCALGAPSPYLESVFPNRPSSYFDYLELDSLPPDHQREWRRIFLYFLQALTYQHRRPLLLKSPTHTARLRTLVDMFERPRFVHIVRNPYDVFPSMVKTLKAMSYGFGLQNPRHEGIEQHVLNIYVRLMTALENGRQLVPASCFYEIRYEDLVADPLARMHDIYENLELGEFDRARPRIEAYLQKLGPSAPPKHAQLDDPTRARIDAAWGPFLVRYGYV